MHRSTNRRDRAGRPSNRVLRLDEAAGTDATADWSELFSRWIVTPAGRRLVFEPLEQRCMLAADFGEIADLLVVCPEYMPMEAAEERVSDEFGTGEIGTGEFGTASVDGDLPGGEKPFIDVERCLIRDPVTEDGAFDESLFEVIGDPWAGDDEWLVNAWLNDVGGSCWVDSFWNDWSAENSDASTLEWSTHDDTPDASVEDWMPDAGYPADWNSWYSDDWYSDTWDSDNWDSDNWDSDNWHEREPLPKEWLRGGSADATDGGGGAGGEAQSDTNGSDTNGSDTGEREPFSSNERGPHFSLSLGGVGTFFPVSSTVVSPTATVVRDPSGSFGDGMILGDSGVVFSSGVGFNANGTLVLSGVPSFPGTIVITGGSVADVVAEAFAGDAPSADSEEISDDSAADSTDLLSIAFTTANVESPSRESVSSERDLSALAQAYAWFALGSREAGESWQPPAAGRRTARR